ncbi:MAG: hypothetical protein U7123_19695 [Potamolinea sp.]
MVDYPDHKYILAENKAVLEGRGATPKFSVKLDDEQLNPMSVTLGKSRSKLNSESFPC